DVDAAMTIAQGIVRSDLAAGLLDQAIVSLGNFAVNVLLARAFPAEEYGIFSIVLSLILLLNTFHQALVTYPLSVRVASADSSDAMHLISVATLATPVLALLCVPLFAIPTASVGRLDLLPFAGAALVAWQLQEVYRRSSLARTAYRRAIISDAVRYLGVPTAIVLLTGWLDVVRVLEVLAVLSPAPAGPPPGRPPPRLPPTPGPPSGQH